MYGYTDFTVFTLVFEISYIQLAFRIYPILIYSPVICTFLLISTKDKDLIPPYFDQNWSILRQIMQDKEIIVCSFNCIDFLTLISSSKIRFLLRRYLSSNTRPRLNLSSKHEAHLYHCSSSSSINCSIMGSP